MWIPGEGALQKSLLSRRIYGERMPFDPRVKKRPSNLPVEPTIPFHRGPTLTNIAKQTFAVLQAKADFEQQKAFADNITNGKLDGQPPRTTTGGPYLLTIVSHDPEVISANPDIEGHSAGPIGAHRQSGAVPTGPIQRAEPGNNGSGTGPCTAPKLRRSTQAANHGITGVSPATANNDVMGLLNERPDLADFIVQQYPHIGGLFPTVSANHRRVQQPPSVAIVEETPPGAGYVSPIAEDSSMAALNIAFQNLQMTPRSVASFSPSRRVGSATLTSYHKIPTRLRFPPTALMGGALHASTPSLEHHPPAGGSEEPAAWTSSPKTQTPFPSEGPEDLAASTLLEMTLPPPLPPLKEEVGDEAGVSEEPAATTFLTEVIAASTPLRRASSLWMTTFVKSSTGLYDLEDVNLVGGFVTDSLQALGREVDLSNFRHADFQSVNAEDLENAKGPLLVNSIDSEEPLTTIVTAGAAKISLELNPDSLEVVDGKLQAVPVSYESPLHEEQKTVHLALNGSKFCVTDGKLDLRTQLTSIGSIATNTAIFDPPFLSEIDEAASTTTMSLAIDPTLQVTGDGQLGVSDDFKTDIHDAIAASVPTYDAPLTLKDAHVKLSFAKGLKINSDNELETNIEDSIKALGGLSTGGLADLGLDEALAYGFSSLAELQSSVPDTQVTFLRLKAGDEFTQKDGKLQMRSLGNQRVPYYGVFNGLSSRPSFTFNETLDTLSVGHVQMTSTFSPASNDAVTQAYVAQYVQSGSAIDVAAETNNRRLLNIRTDATLAVDGSNNLGVNLSPLVDNKGVRVVEGKLATGLTFQPTFGLALENQNMVKLKPTVAGAITFTNENTIGESLTASKGLARTQNDFHLNLASSNTQIVVDNEVGSITGNLAVKSGGPLHLKDNVLDVDLEMLSANTQLLTEQVSPGKFRLTGNMEGSEHIQINDNRISTDLKPYTAGEHISISGNTISAQIPQQKTYSAGPGLSLLGDEFINTMSISAGLGIIVVGSAETGYIVSAEGQSDDDDETTQDNEDSDLQDFSNNPETVSTTGTMSSIFPAFPLAPIPPVPPVVPVAAATLGLPTLLGGLAATGGALFGTVFGYEKERRTLKNSDGSDVIGTDGLPVYDKDPFTGNPIWDPTDGTQLAIISNKETRVTRLVFDKFPEDVRVAYMESGMNLGSCWDFENLITRPWVTSILGESISSVSASVDDLQSQIDSVYSFSVTTFSPDLTFDSANHYLSIANTIARASDLTPLSAAIGGLSGTIYNRMKAVLAGVTGVLVQTNDNLQRIVLTPDFNGYVASRTYVDGINTSLSARLATDETAATALTGRVTTAETTLAALPTSVYNCLKSDVLVSTGLKLTANDAARTLTVAYDPAVLATASALSTTNATVNSQGTRLTAAEGSITSLSTTKQDKLTFTGPGLTTSATTIGINPSQALSTLTLSGVMASTSTADATSSTTAAVQVSGSIWVAKSIYAGLNVTCPTAPTGATHLVNKSYVDGTFATLSGLASANSAALALTTRAGTTESNIAALQSSSSSSSTLQSALDALSTRVGSVEASLPTFQPLISVASGLTLTGAVIGYDPTVIAPKSTVDVFSMRLSTVESSIDALTSKQDPLTVSSGLTLSGTQLGWDSSVIASKSSVDGLGSGLSSVQNQVNSLQTSKQNTLVIGPDWPWLAALLTAAQPQVTSVGTLTGLTVNGYIRSTQSATGEAGAQIVNSSNGAGAFNILRLGNDQSVSGTFNAFLNSSTRTADGGVNTATIRNDIGDLCLQGQAGTGLGLRVYGTSGLVSVLTTTEASATVPGAFQVAGGATISKSLYVAGPTVMGGSVRQLTYGGNYFIDQTVAGSQIILGWNIHRSAAGESRLQVVSNVTDRVYLLNAVSRGSSSGSDYVSIGALTDASTTNGGALRVSGGATVSKTLFVGGEIDINTPAGARLKLLSTNNPIFLAAVPGDPAGDFHIFDSGGNGRILGWYRPSNTIGVGNLTVNGSFKTTDGTDSTSATSGALQTSGAIGVGGAVVQATPHLFFTYNQSGTNQYFPANTNTTPSTSTSGMLNKGKQAGWSNANQSFIATASGFWRFTFGLSSTGFTGQNSITVNLVMAGSMVNYQVFTHYVAGSSSTVSQLTSIFYQYVNAGYSVNMLVNPTVAMFSQVACDRRDHTLKSMLKVPIHPPSLPLSVDLRPNWGPIIDQQTLGSCVSHSLAYQVRYHDPEGAMCSRLFIYWTGRLLEHKRANEDSGLSLRDGCKALACSGAPLALRLQPYVSIDLQLNEMKKSVKDGNPFSIGVRLWESFLSAETASTGVVADPEPKERTVGGHAMTVVAYTASDEDPEEGHFILAIQWGEHWGMGGFCKISFKTLTNPRYISDLWAIHLGSAAPHYPPVGASPQNSEEKDGDGGAPKDIVDWAVNKGFDIGDRVGFNGEVWECLVGHMSISV
ncbi:hypothetical protein PhCBS80983_g04103 [Powellomyces hirtus]|uniref:Peptidase C1A papain C-terminal domain-containing protein n=1 Tax=Powellomyces hirtus TaxID=109895 RepID=A0A507E018_9FUNG|nr:hypothetical protein PhCBS80983_g04103 [Powellomyces hirtus]